jgi:hypothetical protein
LRTGLATALAAIFLGLSAIHVYWGLGGRSGHAAAVPSVDGQRLFVPSRLETFMVATALFVALLVVSGTVGWIGDMVPASVFRVLTQILSLVFLVRAIGDFKYVGFFRRPSESAFAYWDTRLYSPLCLFIAAAALVLSWRKV